MMSPKIVLASHTYNINKFRNTKRKLMIFNRNILTTGVWTEV